MTPAVPKKNGSNPFARPPPHVHAEATAASSSSPSTTPRSLVKFWVAVLCCTCAVVGLVESSKTLPKLTATTTSSASVAVAASAAPKCRNDTEDVAADGNATTTTIGGSDDDSVDDDSVDLDVSEDVVVEEWPWENVTAGSGGSMNGTFLHPPKRPVNYGLEPALFVEELVNCFRDPNCRILYFHMGKTGGQDMEKRMSTFLPPGAYHPCCADALMDRFLQYPEIHCGGQHKFASFEILSAPFLDTIVPTCLSLPLDPRPKAKKTTTTTTKGAGAKKGGPSKNVAKKATPSTTTTKKAAAAKVTGAAATTGSKNRRTLASSSSTTNSTGLYRAHYKNMNRQRHTGTSSDAVPIISGNMTYTAKSRAILLASFREPFQRTLSYIHQACNNHFKFRSEQIQQACTRCSYRKDSPFWNQYAREITNDQYQDFTNVLTARIPNTQALYLDLADFHALFADLYKATNRNRAFNPNAAPTNPQKLGRCNFGFESGMFKQLQPATELYRKLMFGQVVP